MEKSLNSGLFSLDIRLIKRLNAIILIFLALSIIGISTSLQKANRLTDFAQLNPAKDEGSTSDLDYKVKELKPFSYYSEIIGKRQLFKIIAAAESKEKSKAAPNAASLDAIKNYSLLGVIGGENPQAIIEDKKTKQTIYLQKGQSLGELKVRDLQDGKIILESGGETAELSI